jgi:cellulose synthase/poly-beta-1,6-N-acetylglucosamine synthase-like glycosyltransferase
MRESVQPFAGEYGAAESPPEKANRWRTICKQKGRWQQTALGLWLAGNFSLKKVPQVLFREHSLQRTESPQFFRRLKALLLSRDSKLFHVFHTCSKFSLFSFVFSVFYLFFICFYSFHYLSYLVFSSFFLTFFLVFILLLIFSFQL